MGSDSVLYRRYKPESNEATESCKTLILCKLKRLALFLTNVLYRNGQSVFTDLYRLHNHCYKKEDKMDDIAKAKELENNKPNEALKIYKKLIKDNRYFSEKIWWFSFFSATIGYMLTYKINEQIQINRVLIFILLGITAFLPPFILHIKEKFKTVEQKWQKNTTIFMTGFFMFLSVFIMPILISIIVILSTLVLSAPFIFLVKLITNQSFDTMPKVYGIIFGTPAAIITTSYLLSPNRGFCSPFPLSVLFKDAMTALFLGYLKILSIIVGTLFCLSFFFLWKNGFDATTVLLVLISGMFSGCLLIRIDVNLTLGYELNMYRARILAKLGYRYQARYWLGEAAGMLTDHKVSDDIKKELIRLAQELRLNIHSII